MRSEEEIIRAHDILDWVLNDGDELGVIVHPQHQLLAQSAKEALCWVLGHGKAFENNILEIEATLFAKGIILEEVNDDHNSND